MISHCLVECPALMRDAWPPRRCVAVWPTALVKRPTEWVEWPTAEALSRSDGPSAPGVLRRLIDSVAASTSAVANPAAPRAAARTVGSTSA
jgi:hypothetical protein